MTLNTGQTLQNRYRIVILLGQGGMGAVYRAWDTRLQVPVALKEMTPQPGLDPHTLAQMRQQFEQEAVTLAQLKHNHLVNVTDFFEERGNGYLVMEFVEGENLADHITRAGALPESEVIQWADQLLDALAYCHAQGIIHRDVKPQNIVITPEGQAMLVDFGLVKLWDPGDPRTQTAMRGMGTPEYAPPEQYDIGAGHTDPRSDVYGLGATLYHALTGQSPPTATQRIASRSAFQQPRALNESVSPATEAAVLRAMELTVEDRFQDAPEMRSALSRDSGAPFQPAPPQKRPARAKTKVMPGAEPAALPRQRVGIPKWAWALGGLVLLAVMVVVVAGGVAALWAMFSGGGPQAAVGPTSTQRPTATGTATPTRTPRPTSTPTPIPTRTPIPQPTLPSPVSGALSSVDVRYHDDFERLAIVYWENYSPTNVRVTRGLMEINGQYFWATGIALERTVKEKEGVLVLFEYDPGADFNIYLDVGDWDEPSYRRWGIYAGTYFKMNVYKGSNSYSDDNHLRGNLTMKPNTWYYLLLAVDEDAKFVARVWEKNDSTHYAECQQQFDNDWKGNSWEFRIGANEGKAYLDTFTVISFDTIK